jgi:hypothetical protein
MDKRIFPVVGVSISCEMVCGSLQAEKIKKQNAAGNKKKLIFIFIIHLFKTHPYCYPAKNRPTHKH